MDTMQILCCVFLVLLCCQYGVSYRIYILPEPGTVCLDVFSGDDCITCSEYSARPTFVDHSTTLIFTPGNYSLSGTFYVTNIKIFTMIGDSAQLQFPLSLSNIGYVGIHNLTFQIPSYQRFDVNNVHHFVMENCILYKTSVSQSWEAGLYLYRNSLDEIVNCTFEMVSVDIYSYSVIITTSIFCNYSSSVITGDTYSRVVIQNSRFMNNSVSSNLVNAVGSLTIIDCLFDRNSIRGAAGAVYGSSNVTIINSNFTNNEAGGGHAIVGYQNINVSNCNFSYYTESRSVV